MPVGRRPRAAADEHDVARRRGHRPRVERVEAVEQAAHHALDRRACELLAASRRCAVPRRTRSRRAGSACARRRSTARATTPPAPGAASSASASRRVVVDAEQPRDRVGDLGRVERAHERQEATGRVGEARDRAGRRRRSACRSRRRRCPTCRARSRRRPVASPTPSAAAMLSPVPGADDRVEAERSVRRHALRRPEHRRAAAPPSRRRASTSARRSSAVLALRRRPVAGARRVAAIGDERARELPGQPVVRAAARARDARPRLGLAAVQPRQLRDRERGDRHRAARRRPRLPPPSSCVDAATAHRAPTRCRSTASPAAAPRRRVEHDHPVLLTRDRRWPSTSRRVARASPIAVAERGPPRRRVLLAAGWRGRRDAARARAPTSVARVGVADLDLASTASTSRPRGPAARRRASATPSSSSVTSWSSRSWP